MPEGFIFPAVRAMMGDHEKTPQEPMTPIQVQARCLDLRERLMIFQNPPALKPGDLVEPHPLLIHKRYQRGPGIITEILDPPILDTDESPGSPYFRERLDLKVAWIADDGNFVEYHISSNRLRLFQEPPE